MKSKIPSEILYKILGIIQYKYRDNIEEYYKVLHSCILVNKSWFTILFKLAYIKPHFKSKEKFLRFIETLTESVIRQHDLQSKETNFIKLRNYHDYVKQLHISSICYPSNEDIYNLSDINLKLDTLKLEDCRMITDGSLDSLLRSLPDLRTLKLIANQNLTDTTLQNILSHNEKLTELSIDRQVRFTRFGYKSVIRQCSKLKVLQLHHDTGVTDMFFIECACRRNMERLERLDIKYCSSVTNKGIQQALIAAPNLKRFAFTISNTINHLALDTDDQKILNLVNKSSCCEFIEHLEIDNMDFDKYELSIFQLTKMVRKMPRLKVLNLIASVKIGSLRFLPKLIEACPSLEKLYILPLSLSNPKKYDNLRQEIEGYNTAHPNQKLGVYLYNEFLE